MEAEPTKDGLREQDSRREDVGASVASEAVETYRYSAASIRVKSLEGMCTQ